MTTVTIGKKPHRGGQLAIELLFLSAIVIALIGGFVSLAVSFLNLSVRAQNEAQAQAIAEAGIEYYKWHLAYAPQDFTDGTGKPGPYVHQYYNETGADIGQFSLSIIPPSNGSNSRRLWRRIVSPTSRSCPPIFFQTRSKCSKHLNHSSII